MRRGFYEIQAANGSPLATEVLGRVASLYRIEAEIRGRPAETRKSTRQERSRPLIEALHAWLQQQLNRVSGKSAIAEAIRYALNLWQGLIVFLDDGRVELDTNAVERAIRPVAMAGSLCTSSLSPWEHWKCVRVVNATRATFSGDRRLDRRQGKIAGTDLVRRTRHDLHGMQNAGRNQAAYYVVGDIQNFRRLAHGEPFATVVRRAICVNSAHASNRRDAVCGPGFALAGGQTHSIE